MRALHTDGLGRHQRSGMCSSARRRARGLGLRVRSAGQLGRQATLLGRSTLRRSRRSRERQPAGEGIPPGRARHQRRDRWGIGAVDHERDRASIGSDGEAVYSGREIVPREQRWEVGAVGNRSIAPRNASGKTCSIDKYTLASSVLCGPMGRKGNDAIPKLVASFDEFGELTQFLRFSHEAIAVQRIASGP